MGTYRSAVITAAGQNLVAESLTGGKAITFSNAKTSSYAYPEGTNLAELTDLQDIVQAEQPSMAQVINDNVVQVTARFSNENVESSYMIQTLGLYAKINDGDEVLFSVIQAITPDQMPAQNPVSPTAYIFNMQTAIQQASQVTVTVDPAGSATIQDIINLQQSKSYIQVITNNIPVENRADNAWYLYDTDTQTPDLTRYNVEMQDRNGHAYYPHTSSSVVFRPDGTTVEDALNEMGEEIEGGNGKQNLQTYTSLSQLELVAPQTVQQVYTALPDGATAILQCTGTSVISDVPSGVASGVAEITKIGSGSMVRFCTADGTVYFGNLSSGAVAWSKALDADQVLDTMEAVNANSNAGVPAGAQAVKELSGDLIANGNRFYFDYHDGQYGYNTDPERGADTFSPFKSVIYVGTGTSSITVPQGKVPDDAVASDFFLVSTSGSASMSGGETNQRPQGSLSAQATLQITGYSNRTLTFTNSISAYCGMTASPYSANGNFGSVRAYYIKGGLPTV